MSGSSHIRDRRGSLQLAAAPPENLEIYTLIFAIETILRELLIEALGDEFGPFWYLTKFPDDSREHFRSGVEYDRNTRWTINIPHHPVYYLTMPDLRATVESKTNWNAVFKNVFSKNKELLTTDLVEVEFIRNKVAHNRRGSPSDVAIVRAAYEKLCHQIGAARACSLASRYTVETDISGRLAELRREADISFALVMGGRRLRHLRRWTQARGEWWWFDESYLGWSLLRIVLYFTKLVDYDLLGGVQSPGQAKQWALETDLPACHDLARSDLTAILQMWHTD
jgi:hypothetical protein